MNIDILRTRPVHNVYQRNKSNGTSIKILEDEVIFRHISLHLHVSTNYNFHGTNLGLMHANLTLAITYKREGQHSGKIIEEKD